VVGMIVGRAFYDSVPMPGQLNLLNSTELFASDNTTQLAKLGSENRVEVPLDKLKPQVRKALIAGEDKTFYDHNGVDARGIARAAWNNFTGGPNQGGSTITQQYARLAAGDMEGSYVRKAREAVMARKLEDAYTKDQILSLYLNAVYFGRSAHGIGAAAEAYFAIPPERIDTLTVAQAAVLGAALRQPEGQNGYDPARNPDNARSRWGYVLDNMVYMKWLTAADRAALVYPLPKDPNNPRPGELQTLAHARAGGSWGYGDRATGHIVKYVEAELDRMGIRDELREQGMSDWKSAGLRIVTSIDPRAQRALEKQLNRDIGDSTMRSQKANLIGAGVVIDPATGRVLAYYGGSNDGTGTDWAGDDQPHPPASSFKPYTLAAALEAGISTRSLWDATEMTKGLNGAEFDVANAGREVDTLECKTRCTLETLAIQSFNVAFFKVARKIGPDEVVDAAHRAGVKTLWTDDPVTPHRLDAGIPQGRNVFDYQVGFGQYPVSVLDHATGMATLANHGIYHQPHFVLKVDRKSRQTGEWEPVNAGKERVQGRRTIAAEVADEVSFVLKKVPAVQQHELAGGHQSAAKSGTWENGRKKADGVTPAFKGAHAHAWYVGYTEQLATAIWVGSKDHNDTPIQETNGDNMFGAGLPGRMWQGVMNAVNREMLLPPRPLTDGTGGNLGDPNQGEFPVATVPKAPVPSPSRKRPR
jgi:membrane peptidoglycan carboxypeptidase